METCSSKVSPSRGDDRLCVFLGIAETMHLLTNLPHFLKRSMNDRRPRSGHATVAQPEPEGVHPTLTCPSLAAAATLLWRCASRAVWDHWRVAVHGATKRATNCARFPRSTICVFEHSLFKIWAAMIVPRVGNGRTWSLRGLLSGVSGIVPPAVCHRRVARLELDDRWRLQISSQPGVRRQFRRATVMTWATLW